MGFSIRQTSFFLSTPKVIFGLLLLGVFPGTSALAESSQNTSQVSISVTVGGRKFPAQPFAGSNIPGGGWVGGATLVSAGFPSADVETVIISSVASGEGSIAADRLWMRSPESGNEYVSLTDMSFRPLANPNAGSGTQLPDIEFRPTWEDAPGKYHARLKISPGLNEKPGSESGFCDFEAEVPSFLNFDVENTDVRFVPSGTKGQMLGAQNIRVRVTTNSDKWKVKLSSNQDGVAFEIQSIEKGRLSPVSGYSYGTGTVSGRSAVNDYLLVFSPVCSEGKLQEGSVQVMVEGRSGY